MSQNNDGDGEDNIARIVDSLIERLRRGESINWQAVLKEHSRHAEELQRLAPTMEALVKVLVEGAD